LFAPDIAEVLDLGDRFAAPYVRFTGVQHPLPWIDEKDGPSFEQFLSVIAGKPLARCGPRPVWQATSPMPTPISLPKRLLTGRLSQDERTSTGNKHRWTNNGQRLNHQRMPPIIE
jgi:hypothetical protein